MTHLNGNHMDPYDDIRIQLDALELIEAQAKLTKERLRGQTALYACLRDDSKIITSDIERAKADMKQIQKTSRRAEFSKSAGVDSNWHRHLLTLI